LKPNDPPAPKSPKGGQREPPGPGRIRIAARFDETSRTPAMRETTHRWLVNQRQPERSEVRPVARGQRTAKSGGRPRADGRDAETKLRTCLNLVRRPVAQPSAEAGQEASLEIQRARAPGRPCYEAERTPLAVENSVGKPAANWRLKSKRSGLKDVAESTAGIIPGDRGKAGDNWCRPPLPTAKADVATLKSAFWCI
jgi:hypothetical protein